MLICFNSFYHVLHVAARFLLKIVKMWVNPLVHDAIHIYFTYIHGVLLKGFREDAERGGGARSPPSIPGCFVIKSPLITSDRSERRDSITL